MNRWMPRRKAGVAKNVAGFYERHGTGVAPRLQLAGNISVLLGVYSLCTGAVVRVLDGKVTGASATLGGVSAPT